MGGAEPSRVLVIDDDELLLSIARKMLEAEMFAVDVCASVPEALARLPAYRYDAIICDMWMPGMTGKDFYDRVREDFPQYKGRVIFLTGDLASEATWDFVEQNNLPYLLKPINVPEMRRRLREVIGEPSRARPEPVKGKEHRRHHRVMMKANARVRKKKWGAGDAEVTAVVNAGKEGIYFLSDRQYQVGTEVLVAFPYMGTADVEQEGFLVRVDERSDGRRGVGIALGQAAEAARALFAPSTGEHKRERVLALADLTTERPRTTSTTEEITETSDLKLQLAHERQNARRAEQEMDDLRAVYERLVSERDRLAAEQTDRTGQLRELTSTKASLSEAVEDLKRQVPSLENRLAATVAERDRLVTEEKDRTGQLRELTSAKASLSEAVEDLKRQVAALENRLAAAVAERDQAANAEQDRARQLRELTSAKASLSEAVEDLKRQVASLENRLAAALAERDRAESKWQAAQAERDRAESELQAARGEAEKWRAESLRRSEADAATVASRVQELEMEVGQLREQLKGKRTPKGRKGRSA